MSRQIESVKPVELTALIFHMYNGCFTNKLVSLYKVAYEELDFQDFDPSVGWSKTAYFHGARDCGCLHQGIMNSNNKEILPHAWCKSKDTCATRGILNSGFLKAKSPNEAERAVNFALYNSKDGGMLIPIFICTARNVQSVPGWSDIQYVEKDEVRYRPIILGDPFKHSSMAFQGLFLEPLSSSSPDYIKYRSRFGSQLVRLYKITYNAVNPQTNHLGRWSSNVFFHGTGHCGCLDSKK
ncbi:hypothetical protein BG011_006242 [Mortierella polycephala]|uniref:Uncharacterized protein n=1 Tax=Mortierella polycephala TaxID=41804 RepID=A0A9P6PU29_9FUNG|nr:hypothetical protein BG011_006242 [Mortierella polycephala]